MTILILIFWLLLSWGIFVAASRIMQKAKRDWPILLVLALSAAAAGFYIQSVSWKGYGANFSRMVAFQVIVAFFAVLIRHLRRKSMQFFGALVLIASIPLFWLVIQTQWLHLIMIFDASLLDQRITILIGEATFLTLAYMGWIVRPKKHKEKITKRCT